MNKSNISGALLVVDDDDCFRELIVAICELSGIPVFQAATCIEGLKCLDQEESNIKVILMDYYMPGLPASRCAACFRARVGTKIPIVLMTAAVDAAKCAQEVKLTHWLPKPFGIDDFHQTLIDLHVMDHAIV